MSTKALAWAVEQPTGSTLKKCILLLLADLADEQLTCYPGREYLALRAEVAPTTVSKAITALVDDGLLRVLRRARKRGGRSTNRYLIMMYGDETPLPDVDDWCGEFTGGPDETADQGNGAAGAPLPDDDHETAGQRNGAATAPLPEPSNSADAAHSTVLDEHLSNKEDSYPLGVTKDQSPPPPTSTHPAFADGSAAAAGLDESRDVLRQVTVGVDMLRLPTDAERGRLVELVAARLDDGWQPHQLVDRLRGMGPLTTVASVYAVLTSRLRNVGEAPPALAPPAPVRPVKPWCGSCDPVTRRQIDDQGRYLFGVDGLGRVPMFCDTCS